MGDEIDFPQADPAVQYIVKKVSQIEDQYACNANYHRDHLAIKKRLDKMDDVILGLNRVVAQLDVNRINEIQSKFAEISENCTSQMRVQNNESRSIIESSAKLVKDDVCDFEKTVADIKIGFADSQCKFEKTVADIKMGFADSQCKFEQVMDKYSIGIAESSEKIVADAFENLMNRCISTRMMHYLLIFVIAIIIGWFCGVYDV